MNNIPTSSYYRNMAGEEFQQRAVQRAQIELAEEMRKQNSTFSDLISLQQEANKTQKESNKIMEQQIEFLKAELDEQEKRLQAETLWTRVAWIITTAIAVFSAIAPFLLQKTP